MKYLKWLGLTLFYIIISPFLLMVYFILIFKLNKDNFKCNGISVTTKIYQYKDKFSRTVLLIPMIHIGSKRFYKSVEKLTNCASIVLTEGVNDRKQIMNEGIDYSKLAKVVGLVQQKPFNSNHEVNCDGDINDLSATTILAISAVAEILKTGKITQENTKDLMALRNIEDSDILHIRNEELERCFYSLLNNQEYIREKIRLDNEGNKPRKHVDYDRMFEILDELEQLPPKFQSIVVPWGAKHIPFFRKMVVVNGFKTTGTGELYVFSLPKVFFSVLFNSVV